MPKNLKLNLNELKVQSFVTALTDEEKNRFKGGGTGDVDCDPSGSCGGTCVATCASCGSGCLTCSPSWCSGGAACC